ncbi:hypothetical protein EVAR_77511_1 [Eumeta japonica]|uniref:Uncharacterized protein n=1 Tax=Eumeta variegata TaxID=151549 RepID=A0A4C1T6D9_EUMVA|nr:hypothetical protein EVAR_77511_1 [Eumeta japonica]
MDIISGHSSYINDRPRVTSDVRARTTPLVYNLWRNGGASDRCTASPAGGRWNRASSAPRRKTLIACAKRTSVYEPGVLKSTKYLGTGERSMDFLECWLARPRANLGYESEEDHIVEMALVVREITFTLKYEHADNKTGIDIIVDATSSMKHIGNYSVSTRAELWIKRPALPSRECLRATSRRLCVRECLSKRESSPTSARGLCTIVVVKPARPVTFTYSIPIQEADSAPGIPLELRMSNSGGQRLLSGGSFKLHKK